MPQGTKRTTEATQRAGFRSALTVVVDWMRRAAAIARPARQLSVQGDPWRESSAEGFVTLNADDFGRSDDGTISKVIPGD